MPTIAKMPTTTRTSWTSAAMAVAPMRKSWKRKVTQLRMPIEPRTISSRACCAISALMIGPMLASWRTSSMGPNWSSSAKRRSASLPVVGQAAGRRRCRRWAATRRAPRQGRVATAMRTLPTAGRRLRWRPGRRCRSEPRDETRSTMPRRHGARCRAARRCCGGEPDAPGEPEAAGPSRTQSRADSGWRVGNSARPICSVRISTYDLSPAVVIAAVPGRPCSAMTSWTCAGVGVVVGEVDLPDGAAGEVDRELEPDLAAGEWASAG